MVVQSKFLAPFHPHSCAAFNPEEGGIFREWGMKWASSKKKKGEGMKREDGKTTYGEEKQHFFWGKLTIFCKKF